MKTSVWRCGAALMAGVIFAGLAAGCGSVVGGSVRAEMDRRNEADLESGKSTPREYRERRDEIDRNFK